MVSPSVLRAQAAASCTYDREQSRSEKRERGWFWNRRGACNVVRNFTRVAGYKTGLTGGRCVGDGASALRHHELVRVEGRWQRPICHRAVAVVRVKNEGASVLSWVETDDVANGCAGDHQKKVSCNETGRTQQVISKCGCRATGPWIGRLAGGKRVVNAVGVGNMAVAILIDG